MEFAVNTQIACRYDMSRSYTKGDIQKGHVIVKEHIVITAKYYDCSYLKFYFIFLQDHLIELTGLSAKEL